MFDIDAGFLNVAVRNLPPIVIKPAVFVWGLLGGKCREESAKVGSLWCPVCR